ncbi:hypothetical protein HWV62_43975 [Athelia sp. TMB]|nr:hypothetical protein HWV62_43975 [Athelia sp. TMB]
MLNRAVAAYDLLRKWFTLIPIVIAPINYFIDAPFGRFALQNDSIFTVDGIKSWIVMELASPLSFMYTFYHAPLTSSLIPNFTPHLASPTRAPASLLALFFLAHYTNRAIISPLRTPSRSKSHLVVPLAALCFNLINGFLMAAYLSSPHARTFLSGAYGRPAFWAGLALAVAGLAGNILHDEVLFDIRRKAQAKKAAASSDSGGAADPAKPKEKEHYAIPHGYLYAYISYPNYLCEWVEWAGFALAAAPLYVPSSTAVNVGLGVWGLSPPWIFLLNEVLLMTPRALKGHAWYKQKFADYPKERTAVIPWIL